MSDFSILIVVPTLNSYKLLPALVRSLYCQTYDNWRVLFIDGGSCKPHIDYLQGICIDPHFTWLSQSSEHIGIFGAMNQGFFFAEMYEWILFWGSDDWASSNNIFERITFIIKNSDPLPDLIVCKGCYVKPSTATLVRSSRFLEAGILDTDSFRSTLFWGCTPPHQATLFGPGARSRLLQYSPSFRLSADLDYFLKLSRFRDLSICCLNVELVYMGDEGISGKQTRRRLQEVRRAYVSSFGMLWFFPFLLRYIRRMLSLIN